MIKKLLMLIVFAHNISTGMSTTIAVFCSGNNDIGPHIKKITYQLGSFLGAKHYSLITGGGTLGLMKEIVDGYITTTPNLDHCRNVVLHAHADHHPMLHDSHIIWVNSIHQRLEYIYANTDLFIILPGGFGTLHELLDCFTRNKHMKKPIIILNIDGFWDAIIQQFSIIIQHNPSASQHIESLLIANTLAECQLLLKNTIELIHPQ